jgi:hypothetical protein
MVAPIEAEEQAPREAELRLVPDRLEYRLAVLTHGRGSTLDETIDAFYRHARPAPSSAFLFVDDSWPSRREELRRQVIRMGANKTESFHARGFCAATGTLWRWASQPGPDYVVWLEHDHVLERPVDLAAIAVALDSDPRLAQIALMRDPVNPGEVAAGGLFELREGRERWERHAWGFVHRDYFTTNVSMMRREFMERNPWPRYPSECEGRFGLDLVERGYRFGVWGDGSPWTRHIGIRTGMGY